MSTLTQKKVKKMNFKKKKKDEANSKMQPAEERTARIHSMLTKHIGVLDGAMATAIRTQHQLCDASFKGECLLCHLSININYAPPPKQWAERWIEFLCLGERFADHSKSLEGNYDILCITQPQIVKDIHMVG